MIWIVILPALLFLLWFSYRYAWWKPPVDYKRPRILMYHMISEPCRGARFNGLRVSPQMFERQLAWLKDEGWQSFTVSDLVDNADNLPPKSFALTFDDGFEDNYTHAFPLLKKYAFKATLYLVVSRHNRDWSISKKKHHNSGELKREPKLSDEQVAEMLDSGLFELGAHTLTHANLDTLSDIEKTQELQQAKNDLEQKFGVRIQSFAYPFGIYRPSDIALVNTIGYQNAVTTESGIEKFPPVDPYQLKRVKISGKDNFFAFVMRMKTGKRGWSK